MQSARATSIAKNGQLQSNSPINFADARSLAVQKTDMFSKTRRECMPALTVLPSVSVSCIKPSHLALGVAELGTAIWLVECNDKTLLIPIV